jgi:ABC-type glycerol-3-phosphate transport system substrate-binding protein
MHQRKRVTGISVIALLCFLTLMSGMLFQLSAVAPAQADSTESAQNPASDVSESAADPGDAELDDSEEYGILELTAYQRRPTYSEYISQFAGVGYPDQEVLVQGAWFTSTDMDVEVLDAAEIDTTGLPADYQGTAVVTGEKGYIEWEIDVPVAGLYNIEVMYYPVTGRGTSIEREILINGKVLFDGSDALIFHRVWGDSGPFLTDTAGNQIRPTQVEKPMWRVVTLEDSIGYVQKPYKFYFEQGKNTLRFISRAEPMAIASLRLYQAEDPRSYADVLKEYESKGYKAVKDVLVTFQAEDAVRRSSPSLFAVFDQGDPTLVPYHPAEARLNSIGGHRWQIVGDWISWEFEVPEDGLYQIAIKGKQDQNRGTFSNRKVLIDGEVPFAELLAVRFNHTDRYQMRRLGVSQNPALDEVLAKGGVGHVGRGGESRDEPFLFYLTKGKHELTLVACLGDLAGLLEQTEISLYELNTIYRNIIMITSATPDPLRSYQLEKRIPGLLERLKVQAEIMRSMAAELESLTGQRGGHTAVLTDIAIMLERMVEKPWAIPNMLAEYRDGIGNLGTWVMNTRNQPLQTDYIIAAAPDAKLPRAEPTFFQAFWHEIRAFLASFTHDYSGIRDITAVEDSQADIEDKAIKVWIGLGRDQAQVLKQMLEDSFTPETGIPVVLELVDAMQSLLVPATIAGRAPDVALGAANMDLAFRGAVADLTQFPDFEEVAKRFKKSALLTFRFRDKVFALPEAQAFPMLFYRKDVLAELGLEVPQTWEEVYAIIPELQKRHLEFGMWPDMYTYTMFLYQKSVPLYKEDCIATNLESEAAIATFEEMTDLYTLYGLPLVYNFINRFRTGEMPLAIASYVEFNTLAVFAPELRGEWGFAPVPGIRQADGTINRTVPVHQAMLLGPSGMMPQGTTGSIIMEKSKKKEQAWEFLRWWTRTDTQVRFGREMEALVGAAARWATANVEAMQQLPWKVEDREQLNAQWDWVEGIPPVLGGYYVTRQFDWLFRAIVLDNEPIRESVLDRNREIDREITRKRIELGYETDYEELDPKWKQLYWDHYTHVSRLEWEKQPDIDLWKDLGLDLELGLGLSGLGLNL